MMEDLALDQQADTISHFAQFGIVGAILAALFGLVIVPLIRALLAQNNRLLDQYQKASDQNETVIELLRKSVESQIQAVHSFQHNENQHQEIREMISQGFDRQEEMIRKIPIK